MSKEKKEDWKKEWDLGKVTEIPSPHPDQLAKDRKEIEVDFCTIYQLNICAPFPRIEGTLVDCPYCNDSVDPKERMKPEVECPKCEKMFKLSRKCYVQYNSHKLEEEEKED